MLKLHALQSEGLHSPKGRTTYITDKGQHKTKMQGPHSSYQEFQDGESRELNQAQGPMQQGRSDIQRAPPQGMQ